MTITIGDRYGRLTVVEKATSDKFGATRVICRCDCGKVTHPILANNLRRGGTRSCGCLATKTSSRLYSRSAEWTTIHGHNPSKKGKPSKTYNTWAGMIQRCSNPKYKQFKDYGGSGVTVCKRWRTFNNFLQDMGERPAGTTIDRINPRADYHPKNCRWATRSEQDNNKRRNILSLL